MFLRHRKKQRKREHWGAGLVPGLEACLLHLELILTNLRFRMKSGRGFRTILMIDGVSYAVSFGYQRLDLAFFGA